MSTTHPSVLNLSKLPGRDVPAGAIYIGDRCTRAGYRLPQSKWFNRFKIGKPDRKRDGTRDQVIAKHKAWLADQPALLAALPELRGRDLVCWCKSECGDVPCHGDVLLELANR